MTPDRRIIEAGYALARQLPGPTLEDLAAAVLAGPAIAMRSEIDRRIPHHAHRDLALAFVDLWRTEAPGIGSPEVAMLLRTAAHAGQVHRDTHSVELAWTGPESECSGFRRTEQAILQVLDSARSRITLVSFAVYRIPNIARALVKASGRGVRLTVVVETPDRLEGQGEYSTIRALGPEVAACASVYYWPRAERSLGSNGKVGLLHVKCVVADGEWLFLSSANLTQQAFTINMELGLLVRDTNLARSAESQFDRLIRVGRLKSV